jgi:hypothetical protein
MRVRHVEWVGTGQRIADACRLRHSLPESTATYQDCRVRCNCPPRPGHENNSRHRTAEAPPEVLRRKVSRGHVLGHAPARQRRRAEQSPEIGLASGRTRPRQTSRQRLRSRSQGTPRRPLTSHDALDTFVQYRGQDRFRHAPGPDDGGAPIRPAQPRRQPATTLI